ncbi:MAG TPA: hypothetical protein VEV84_14885 [Pyrinomonadaceae bacterium]|jgi:hypothetical protein|nr:hypothetical protein [Pyrinomonadaceae bacterium]
MLFILIILIVLAASISIAVFVKRQIDRDLIESQEPKQLTDTNLRPLFAEDEEEERDEEQETSSVIEAEPVDETREKKLAKLEEVRQTWGENPDRRNTLELLAAAAETGIAEIYAAEAGEIVGRFRKGEIASLTAADMADLLETHLWLLPAQERMSGEGFLVKQEIADLRVG